MPTADLRGIEANGVDEAEAGSVDSQFSVRRSSRFAIHHSHNRSLERNGGRLQAAPVFRMLHLGDNAAGDAIAGVA